MRSGADIEVVRRLLRAVPVGVPGKTRLARLAVRRFHDDGPVLVPDRFGNSLWVPSLREPIGLSLFASGVYEPETLAAALAHLPPSGIFVDVGANIGALALPLAATRPDAHIVCIEADPEIAAILRSNVALNNRQNIRVIECIAGPFTQQGVSFYRAPREHFGMGSIGPQFSSSPIKLDQ